MGNNQASKDQLLLPTVSPRPFVFVPERLKKDGILKEEKISSEELKYHQQKDAENDCTNIWNRLYRTAFVVISIIIFLPLTAILKDEYHLFTIYGFGALFTAVAYAIHLFYLVFRAYFQARLYRVHTLNDIPPNWASMSIAYKALLYKHQPIESISEFSAIQGGVAQTMMFGCAVSTMTILACAFMSEIHQHSFKLTCDDVMIIIGAFGLVTVGTYQLDPNNAKMIIAHYIGVLLSLGIFFAFNYQQIYMIYEYPDEYTSKRLWFPLLLDIISLIGFVAWQYAGYEGRQYNDKIMRKKTPSICSRIINCCFNNDEIVDENEDNHQVSIEYDPKYISLLSVSNLGAEGIYFIGAGVSLASWMIFYPYANCPEWVNSL